MEFKGDSRNLLERFIIFFSSTTFTLTVLQVFSGIFKVTELLDFEAITPFVYIVVIVLGVLYTSALDYFITARSKLRTHVLLAFTFFVLVILASLFFRQFDAPYALIPASIIQYIVCARLNAFFVAHEEFLYKIDRLKGEELRTYLFHNHQTASDFSESLKKAQTVLIVIAFSVFVAIIAGKFIGVEFNVVFITCTLCFFISIFMGLILLGIYNKEIYFSFLGFTEVLPHRERLFKLSFVILIACSVIALAISSDSALIKIKKIEPKERETVKIENIEPPHQNYDFQSLDFGDNTFGREHAPAANSALLWLILSIVAKVLLALGALLLVAYVIYRMIMSGGLRAFFKEGIFTDFIQKLFSDLAEFFRTLFHFNFGKKEKYASVQSKSFKSAIEDFLRKSKKTRAKKIEIDRLTRQFMTLIDWGTRRNITYKVTMAPAEYTAKLQLYFAENDRTSLSPYTQAAGALFEKALYDKNTLSPEEEDSFTKAVKSITSYTVQ